MFKEYILPVLIVVAGMVLYNLVVSKLLNMNYEENYEVIDGKIVNR